MVSETNTVVQSQALDIRIRSDQCLDFCNIWRKPGSLRGLCSSHVSCLIVMMVSQHTRRPSLQLALDLAPPAPALSPTKVVAAKHTWGKTQPMLISDPSSSTDTTGYTQTTWDTPTQGHVFSKLG